MKTLDVWLSQYSESHQNPVNKKVHFICVPLIFFTIVALLYSIPATWSKIGFIEVNVATLISILIVVYYMMLSPVLAVGMGLFTFLCLLLSAFIESALGGKTGLAITGLVLFILAWIAQFWGHKVEGKKPSFIKDLQFLLIGPAWVMTYFIRKAGINI